MAIKSKVINQSEMTGECWNIQFWGKEACEKCEYKNTKQCGGKAIRKTGKNANGFKIPLN